MWALLPNDAQLFFGRQAPVVNDMPNFLPTTSVFIWFPHHTLHAFSHKRGLYDWHAGNGALRAFVRAVFARLQVPFCVCCRVATVLLRKNVARSGRGVKFFGGRLGGMGGRLGARCNVHLHGCERTVGGGCATFSILSILLILSDSKGDFWRTRFTRSTR